mgnify:CR=1 FL=1
MSDWIQVLKAPGVVLFEGMVVLILWGICVLKTSRLFISAPPVYKQGEGACYAISLSDSAQRLSLFFLVIGWVMVIIGAILALAATFVRAPMAQPDQDMTIVEQIFAQRGLILGIAAVVVGGGGWQLLDRSAAASKVASAATRAIAVANDGPEQDRDAYDACVLAKASWLDGRMNHDRLEAIVSDLNRLPRSGDDSEQGDGKD